MLKVNTGHNLVDLEAPTSPLPYEPKRTNRWLLKIKDTEVPIWVPASTSRPSLYFGLFGNIKCKPISIILRDPIGPSTSQEIYKLFIDKIRINISLEMLDPCGTVVERWEINECKITNVDFGWLDYSDNNIVQLEIIIQPKKVELIF